ncbi:MULTISPECIES: ATP-dependent acyl-CoA ligase [unclassified Arthrobacter]|uniref:ATP-dependent acyl-CoA ligase n=1 Tax=unclassified Arthrobacter TaxID=235627 RepID=UPI001EFF5221|nr:ATP-dependent acyl-CoA ligase [Arthrobacter sp. FW305-BF8]UKA56271.1 AMP-binding protein [Arthrobacter sp. FW305-BF8]
MNSTLAERRQRPLTIPQMLLERAQKAPSAPLFRCGDVRRDSQAMVDAVARTGGTLRGAGIERHQTVALMSSNRTELLDLILGCAWIGAVAVPVNTASRGEQLRHVLENSEASLVVAEAELLAHIAAVAPASLKEVWVLDGPALDVEAPFEVLSLPEPGPAVDPVGTAPGEAAAILYTSGTTGVSKGVLCPQGQFYWWAVNMSDQLGLRADDVLYTCLPLFHTNALNAFMQAVECGGEYVLGPRFSASRFWTDASSAGATVTYLLGAMVGILAGKDPGPGDRDHRIRVALSPATPARLVEPFRDRFGVLLLDGYGSTETNSVIGSTPDLWRPGYMGKVRPGFSIRVVDVDGVPLPSGVAGELLIRSDQPHAMATGYHAMADATTKAWQDLWFHSGDRVVVDEDGWVRFVDRIKDVIRRRGENISSVEVEQALRQHPAIQDAAVYAVDSELGEDEVMAALVLREPVDFGELCEFCAPRLASFAIPRFVRVVDQLPQTENGKVRKQVLKAAGRGAAQWDREVALFRRTTATAAR